MKTAVEAIFVGKARQYNRRFLQMCSHHLVEPVACTPALGWEKGQAETGRQSARSAVPAQAGVSSLAELNVRLADQCIAYAKRHKHPEFKDRTIWEVFQEEQASLMELRGPFDGFVEKAVRATTTCLIMADHNRYSVDARAAGRMVLVRSHAERIVVLLGDEGGRPSARLPALSDHLRSLALSACAGAQAGCIAQRRAVQGLGIAAGAGPGSREAEAACRRRSAIRQSPPSVLAHGLSAVEAACAEALAAGIASGDVILTVLARRHQPPTPASITTPDGLRLKVEPVADCGRYDSIRKVA